MLTYCDIPNWVGMIFLSSLRIFLLLYLLFTVRQFTLNDITLAQDGENLISPNSLTKWKEEDSTITASFTSSVARWRLYPPGWRVLKSAGGENFHAGGTRRPAGFGLEKKEKNLTNFCTVNVIFHKIQLLYLPYIYI